MPGALVFTPGVRGVRVARSTRVHPWCLCGTCCSQHSSSPLVLVGYVFPETLEVNPCVSGVYVSVFRSTRGHPWCSYGTCCPAHSRSPLVFVWYVLPGALEFTPGVRMVRVARRTRVITGVRVVRVARSTQVHPWCLCGTCCPEHSSSPLVLVGYVLPEALEVNPCVSGVYVSVSRSTRGSPLVLVGYVLLRF